MKPINQQERSKAFWRFLMFFVITVAVMITALFFSFQVPFKDNDRMRKEMAKIDDQRAFLLTFQNKMQQTISLLDSLSKSGNNFPFINNEITKKINEMSFMLNDSIVDSRFYLGVVNNLLDLQNAKTQLKETYDKDKDVGELKEEINDLKNELTRCQTSLATCNQLLQNK